MEREEQTFWSNAIMVMSELPSDSDKSFLLSLFLVLQKTGGLYL